MASRSVNSLRLSKDDMMRVYRDHARRQRGGVKIGHIIETMDILVPVIPHFFGQSRVGADVDPHRYNRRSMGYAGEDDMSYQSSGRCSHGMASSDAIGNGRYGLGMASSDVIDSGRYGHDMSYGNVRGNGHYEVAHADHYGDRIISEEEFERLLDYAEARNHVKMY